MKGWFDTFFIGICHFVFFLMLAQCDSQVLEVLQVHIGEVHEGKKPFQSEAIHLILMKSIQIFAKSSKLVNWQDISVECNRETAIPVSPLWLTILFL